MSENLPMRTIEEISASIRAHAVNMAMSYIAIGHDLIDAKAQLAHSQWLPWLKSMGFATSTAANYMKLAREVSQDSPLAQLPYSKALALLALPAAERDAMAEEARDMSAAELRRVTAQRDKAIEAANAETNRANALREQLDQLLAQPPRVVREAVEVVPADYDAVKAQAAQAEQEIEEAVQVAARAEQRANEAEARLERFLAQGAPAPQEGDVERLARAITEFINVTQLMAVNPAPLAQRKREADQLFKRLKLHILDLEKAVDDADWEAVGSVV